MTSIANGESGSSVRTKLNAALLQADALQLGSRAALVSLGSYTNGALYSDGEHLYRGSTGATAIPDIDGLVPVAPYNLAQWGVVPETNTGQKTSSEDWATEIQAAIDWMQENGGGVLSAGTGVIAFNSTIYMGDGTYPVLLVGEGRGITGAGKTAVRASAATRFLWGGSATVKSFVLTSDRTNGGAATRNGGGGVLDIMFDGAEIGTAATSIPSADVFGTSCANGGWLFNVISHSGHHLRLHLAYRPGGCFLSTCLSNGLASGPADTQRGVWDIWTSDANTAAEPYAHVLITGSSAQTANTSLMDSIRMTLRPESTAIAAHLEFSDGSVFDYLDASTRTTASGDGGKIILHADDTLTTYHGGAYTSQGHCRRHTFNHIQSKSELDALATVAGSSNSGPNTVHTWSRGNGAARPRVEAGAVLNYWDEEEGIAAPGWLSKASRAELVTFCSNYTPIPGAIYSDGTVQYVGQAGATVIPDLPGLVPFTEDGSYSIRHFGAACDGTTDDTTAIQAAFDAALAVLQADTRARMVITMPRGRVKATDELLSDEFQSAWWSQTNLGKGKVLTVRGAPGRGTEIVLGFSSACRNSTNGNERDYGPWSGEPSPAILFPALSLASPTPAAFELQNIAVRGSDVPGKDPIIFYAAGELDAFHEELHFTGTANSAIVAHGTFNSTYRNVHVEACGMQPSWGGERLGSAAGFPPPWVRVDITGGNTLTAKAGAAYDGYNVGDTVPFFEAGDVGKTVYVHQGASHGGTGQPLRATIAGFTSASVVTFTAPSGVTVLNGTSKAISFPPVQATTTAASATVTLSDYVLIGAGAADMLGLLVSIPKAGSSEDTDRDVLTTRIVGVGSGNDTTGYLSLTLADSPANSVTEDIIFGSSLNTATDEALLAAGIAIPNMNDTDFIACRFENSGGYNEDVTTSSYVAVIGQSRESTTFVSCKFHGSNPLRGQFAQEGQIIVDDAAGLSFTGGDFTHFGLKTTGAVRLMGAAGIVTFNATAFGGWQLSDTFKAIYLDPKSGYSGDDWSVLAPSIAIKNDSFPVYTQAIYGGTPSVADVYRYTTDRDQRGGRITALTSADDLDDFLYPGSFSWEASAPTNAPTSGTYSNMIVFGTPSKVTQLVHDRDNDVLWVRAYFSGAWRGWRRQMPALSGSTASRPTTGLFQGLIYYDTTLGKPIVYNGTAWEDEIATSLGTTGGSGSAGAGNQYIAVTIGGTTYKVLHDGTV